MLADESCTRRLCEALAAFRVAIAGNRAERR
jgi:hypothetical protein